MNRLKMMRKCFLALTALGGLLLPAPQVFGADYFMYIGTYTNQGGSKGIYAWRFDAAAGKFTIFITPTSP